MSAFSDLSLGFVVSALQIPGLQNGETYTFLSEVTMITGAGRSQKFGEKKTLLSLWN